MVLFIISILFAVFKQIIGNCVSILVLSSALPVMSRTLGLDKLHLSNNPRDSETKPSANGHQKTL
uniref:Uncharacterized protein n=1 Tax=Pavo cristatus TaxID=9049 RepID=A0A8C9FNK9_PAVCR